MNGDLVVVDDVTEAFATTVVEAYRGRPNDGFAMSLSGGGTARACYERLAADAGDAIDWWKVDLYWGDERCVPLDDPDSNYRLAREALLDRVGAANATYPMRCDEGADAYQLRLGELGRFDLVHLGLGPDGHTASLFPGSAALDAPPGRLVALNDDPLGHNVHPRMTLTFEGIARAASGGGHGRGRGQGRGLGPGARRRPHRPGQPGRRRAGRLARRPRRPRRVARHRPESWLTASARCIR